MIPRGAGVGNIRREATKPVRLFVARDESQERWKDGKAEAKDLSGVASWVRKDDPAAMTNGRKR